MRVTAAAEAVGTCPSAVNALQLRPRQEQQGGYDYKQSWRNQPVAGFTARNAAPAHDSTA